MEDLGVDVSTEMAERFLADRGHGVLSLANEGVGYGIPLSYGYDALTDRCIMQFVTGQEGRKREFLETSETVTLATYEYESDGTWQSVIATGTLRPLSNDEVADRAAAIFFSQAANADTHTRLAAEGAETEWYALEIETLVGRESATGDEPLTTLE
ncbi:pyridoxamine 5'-phosphate oxidase family protein [Natronobeatus ordinarius]|uniref:pyridoxamine 5'-phosphate oxidase family protein n=1 Tax=Natronobeatus ordinarius TaxID=2963433 RepID=UPI0020CD0267|nr:pyridoxamine 5'-phosphate oxidase family protein [Natronobeatus ordinarius]